MNSLSAPLRCFILIHYAVFDLLVLLRNSDSMTHPYVFCLSVLSVF